eukprot:699593-Pleurochrysis_carterae.AAC.1
MLVLPATRALLASHALYYTFVGIAYLTFPADVPDMFYLDDTDPQDHAVAWSTDLKYPLQRYSGAVLISLETFVLVCAYANTVQAFIGAILAISPFHICVLIMCIITENTMLMIVNGAIIAASVFLLLMLSGCFNVARTKVQKIGGNSKSMSTALDDVVVNVAQHISASNGTKTSSMGTKEKPDRGLGFIR